MKIPFMILFAVLLFTANTKAQNKPKPSKIETDKIVDYFEPQPEFPGGEKAFNKFLSKNLKRPNQDDVQGQVIISFVVEKDGHLTNFKVGSAPGYAKIPKLDTCKTEREDGKVENGRPNKFYFK